MKIQYIMLYPYFSVHVITYHNITNSVQNDIEIAPFNARLHIDDSVSFVQT